VKFETKAIRLAHEPDPKHRAVISPLHLGTTFQFAHLGDEPQFDYSRSNNPTRDALERTLAGLEGGTYGVAFASGMAACDGVLATLKPGDQVVSARQLYGGMPRLFEEYYRPRGVDIRYVDQIDDPSAFTEAITGKTRMIWVETPTNPQLQLIDIAAVGEIAKQHQIPLVVDNTFASPYFQQPLELGADIVVHSTTKYIAGHHDVLGGAVITSNEKWYEKVRHYQNTAGAVPSSFDCYMISRGLKTLALRMRQHEASAFAIVKFLKNHPAVESVIYPGLEDHPQHELAKKQMSGFGGMVSVFLKADLEQIECFCLSFKIFHFAESLGGAESLICHPTTMSHAVLTEEERLAAGVTPQMIRISVGLEHEDDLIEDLENALQAM
jgi:cystathionine gamma-lyase